MLGTLARHPGFLYKGFGFRDDVGISPNRKEMAAEMETTVYRDA